MIDVEKIAQRIAAEETDEAIEATFKPSDIVSILLRTTNAPDFQWIVDRDEGRLGYHLWMERIYRRVKQLKQESEL